MRTIFPRHNPTFCGQSSIIRIETTNTIVIDCNSYYLIKALMKYVHAYSSMIQRLNFDMNKKFLERDV